MMHNPFTQTGALAQHDPLFRGRAAELSQLERACLTDHKSFLLVYGGRQNGKTSLLLRLESRLRERLPERVRVCRVDFQDIPRVTTDAAFQHLIAELRRTLPHLPPAPPSVGIPELRGFLEQALAGDEVQRLVLLLDELARLPETTREDLAHVIRALHTHRLVSPALAKTQFVLAGGLELYDLAIVQASTLRNVCEIVRLGDLSESDATALIGVGLTLVGVTEARAADLGRAVYARVRGHPYLTQRVGGLLADCHLRGDPLDDTMVETLCWELLEGEDALLEHLRRSIGDLQLAGAARRLLTASQRTTTTDDDTARLELLGLARRDGRSWAPRSPLLAVALAEWLHVGMPETDRMTDAAQAVRHAALTRYLSDLKLEQTTTTSHAERAASHTEQMRLQHHANEIADEINQMEAEQRVKPPVPAPTVPAPVVPSSTPITPKATQPPLASTTSVKPSLPAPAVATVGVRARRYGWVVVIPFLVIIAVIAIPQTRSALIGGMRQPTVSSTPLPIALVPNLVKVAAGSFLMGSTDADLMANSDEKPQHTLNLPDYWIGKTEVTNAQFRPFVTGDGYTNKDYWTKAGWDWREAEKIVKPYYWDDANWNSDTQPVVGISWFEAVAYCHWLSAQTGHEFRLPSEAEWEKAARGPDGRIWPWGNTWESNRANSSESGIGKTTPVGQYPNGASPYGALDMAGNAWEWVATKYGKGYPYQLDDEWTRAYLEDGDSGRVWRSGSLYHEQKSVRGAYRNINTFARNRITDIGLRVASRSPLPGSGS